MFQNLSRAATQPRPHPRPQRTPYSFAPQATSCAWWTPPPASPSTARSSRLRSQPSLARWVVPLLPASVPCSLASAWIWQPGGFCVFHSISWTLAAPPFSLSGPISSMSTLPVTHRALRRRATPSAGRSRRWRPTRRCRRTSPLSWRRRGWASRRGAPRRARLSLLMPTACRC